MTVNVLFTSSGLTYSSPNIIHWLEINFEKLWHHFDQIWIFRRLNVTCLLFNLGHKLLYSILNFYRKFSVDYVITQLFKSLVGSLIAQGCSLYYCSISKRNLNFSFHILFLFSFMFNNFFIVLHDFFLFLCWGWSFWRPFFGINLIP